MDTLKESYKDLIQQMNISETLKKYLREFINTYDGTNIPEFNMLMLSMIQFFKEYKITKIKADGYDRFVQTRTKYKNLLENIKKEYQDEMSGSYDKDAPISSHKMTQDELDQLHEDISKISFNNGSD